MITDNGQTLYEAINDTERFMNWVVEEGDLKMFVQEHWMEAAEYFNNAYIEALESKYGDRYSPLMYRLFYADDSDGIDPEVNCEDSSQAEWDDLDEAIHDAQELADSNQCNVFVFDRYGEFVKLVTYR